MKLLFLATRCQYQLGPLAKVGLSGKFGVVVFKSSILDSLGGSIGHVKLPFLSTRCH